MFRYGIRFVQKNVMDKMGGNLGIGFLTKLQGNSQMKSSGDTFVKNAPEEKQDQLKMSQIQIEVLLMRIADNISSDCKIIPSELESIKNWQISETGNLAPPMLKLKTGFQIKTAT